MQTTYVHPWYLALQKLESITTSAAVSTLKLHKEPPEGHTLRSKTMMGMDKHVSRPKKTRQGNGKHSKPNHGRKQKRGQG